MRRITSSRVFPRSKARFWDGTGWRDERRFNVDHHVGRRRSDVWFPYNPAFVVQALDQTAGGRTGMPSGNYSGLNVAPAGRRYSLDT